MVEWFSGKPTLGDLEGENPSDIVNIRDGPIYKRCQMPHVVNAHPIAKKRHRILPQDSKEAKLVFILRDYKECVSRHCGLSTDFAELDRINSQLNWYMSLVQEFDQWPMEKLLVYYEDLISNPTEAALTLLWFMGIYKESDFKVFFEDEYQRHLRNALGVLKLKAATHGMMKSYHKNYLSDHAKREMDDYLAARDQDIFDRFLIRYKEVST